VHLALAVPADWSARELGDGRRAFGPPGAELVIEVDDLVPLPDEPLAWIAAAMARGLPAGAALVPAASESGQSSVGWPMEIVPARVADAGGATVEVRLGAFYRLGEWGGHALVRARDAARFDAARAQLVQILVDARPIWKSRDSVVCIADLYG
jgi:hypothetical protein